MQRLLASRRIQAKLQIGKPGDRYEQEADSVADRVMSMPDPSHGSTAIQHVRPSFTPVQRLCEECGEKAQRKEEAEEKEALNTLPVQRQEMEKEKPGLVQSFLQRQQSSESEENGQLQKQEGTVEEPLQTRLIQRQEMAEEEESPAQALQRQQESEEEEVAQALSLQRQEMKGEETVAPQAAQQVTHEGGEEETLNAWPIQKQEEEEPVRTQLVQTQSASGGGEEEAAQTDPVQQQGMEEEEAEAVQSLQRREQGQEESDLAQTRSLQRQEAEEPQPSPELMTKPDAAKGPAIPPGFESGLRSSRGEGQSLSDQTRAFFEPHFGHSLATVRVHTGARADQMNRSIHAHAFTRGADIYFGSGKFDPGSAFGKRLLAHELTHVVQQGKAPVAPQLRRSPIEVQKSSWWSVQRQESADSDDRPTEEEKAVALAAAERANKAADQSRAEGKGKVAESRAEQAAEKEAGQAAWKKAEAASADTSEGPAGTDAAAEGTEAEVGAPAMEGAPEQTGAAPPEGRPKAASAEAPPEGSPGIEPTAEGAKAPVSPEEDTAFQTVLNKVRGVGSKQRSHAPAKAKADEAQAAALSPPEEISGKAQNRQVGEMAQAETPAFDAASFKARLLKRIEELTPKTVEDADNFKANNKLGSVKGEMQSQVAKEKGASQGPLEEKTSAPPDTSGVEPKPVTPILAPAPGAPPPDVGAAKAAPKSKGTVEVESPLAENSRSIDQEIKKENVTEEQLAKSNEPQFQSALEAKKEAQAHSQEAPQAYRQFEQEQLTQAETAAAAAAMEKTQGMHAGRSELFNKVGEQQGSAKIKDEQSRQTVGADIQKIYGKTKARVEKILSDLDPKVENAFEQGAKAAREVFEDYVEAKMEAYKERRYGGWFGWSRWLKDKLLGMPSEVNRFYVAGRNLYLEKMDAVIDSVVETVGAGLAEAKAEIAKGKQEIADYVDRLPKDLKKVGQQASQDVQDKFNELEQSVDNKQDELIDTLAQKYQENLKAVDARIEEMKSANRGLVDKAINFVVGVVQAIIKLKSMLMRVLAKVKSVVLLIIQDPIGFLGNLISGIGQGIKNFASNIMTHLQTGLIGWLTGALGPVGIQIPEDLFSLKGIFSLVLQVLGLTWDYIRAKAVKLLGEPAVKFLETGFEMFQILKKEGPGGLWEWVKDQFSDLKETVIEEIKSMVITSVIDAGVKWLMGLLSPVGAFVKAAMAIYEIVMFFVRRAAQIIQLIEAIVDAVAAIARGAIGGAAKLVENALAKALPLVIGFLAALLGVSGLAKKVQGVIKKLRKRIDKAIDKVLLKARRLVSKGGKAIRAGAMKAQRFFFPKHGFRAGGKAHTLKVKIAGDRPQMIISSNPQPVEQFLAAFEGSADLSEKQRKRISEAKSLIRAEINPLAIKIQKAWNRESEASRVKSLQRQLLEKQVRLSDLIRLIVGTGELKVDKLEYHLEGQTGTYASMPKPTRDDMTADHQPQAAILEYAAGLPYFAGQAAMQSRAGQRAASGYAINLQSSRHRAGRTYGSKGTATKKLFKSRIKSETRNLNSDRIKRSKVVDLIKEDLSKDVATMRGVANNDSNYKDIKKLRTTPEEKKTLKEQVKGQILTGENQVASQDLDSLKGS